MNREIQVNLVIQVEDKRISCCYYTCPFLKPHYAGDPFLLDWCRLFGCYLKYRKTNPKVKENYTTLTKRCSKCLKAEVIKPKPKSRP